MELKHYRPKIHCPKLKHNIPSPPSIERPGIKDDEAPLKSTSEQPRSTKALEICNGRLSQSASVRTYIFAIPGELHIARFCISAFLSHGLLRIRIQYFFGICYYIYYKICFISRFLRHLLRPYLKLGSSHQSFYVSIWLTILYIQRPIAKLYSTTS